jgi:hypothetical protein
MDLLRSRQSWLWFKFLQFGTVFSLGNGKNDDRAGQEAIIGPEIAAPQAIKRGILTRQLFYPGFAEGEGIDLQMGRDVPGQLNGLTGFQGDDVFPGSGAEDDAKLFLRHDAIPVLRRGRRLSNRPLRGLSHKAERTRQGLNHRAAEEPFHTSCPLPSIRNF